MATLASIHTAVVAALVALGGSWSQSPLHPQAFARTPDSIAHCAFAVDIPSSEEAGNRNRGATPVKDQLVVRFYARVVPTTQVLSFTEALALEEAVRSAVVAVNGTGANVFHAIYQRSTREINAAGDYQLVTLTFTLTHYATL